MFWRKVNTAYYFYDYCYTVLWHRIWHKRLPLYGQNGGVYFAVTCFILYVFLAAVILWRLGIHARWSAPFMLWLDMIILIYGIYLGSKRLKRQQYFRVFSWKKQGNTSWFFIYYLILFSPFLTVIFSILVAKPLFGLHSR